MPAWLIPALKAVLPHLGAILSAGSPVFTKKSADAAASQAVILQQQITELQAAASTNDAHIKELAAQIQQAVTALEQSASIAEKRQQQRHRQSVAVGIASIIFAAAALCIAILVLVAR